MVSAKEHMPLIVKVSFTKLQVNLIFCSHNACGSLCDSEGCCCKLHSMSIKSDLPLPDTVGVCQRGGLPAWKDAVVN